MCMMERWRMREGWGMEWMKAIRKAEFGGSMNRIKLHNARIITPFRQFENGYVLVEDGLIAAVGEGDLQVDDCVLIDVQGNWLTPGFIDIHTHGGGGHDFMDGTVEAYLGAVETHARPVSYTHLRAHETRHDLVCRLLLEK